MKALVKKIEVGTVHGTIENLDFAYDSDVEDITAYTDNNDNLRIASVSHTSSNEKVLACFVYGYWKYYRILD